VAAFTVLIVHFYHHAEDESKALEKVYRAFFLDDYTWSDKFLCYAVCIICHRTTVTNSMQSYNSYFGQ
jgi:hypothetical protein